MADIYGKIIAVLPTRSGTSARGTQWSSQTAVIETLEQYPKKLAFDVMGERIANFNLQVGECLTVQYDFDAHESNGRWFNSCRAWNVIRLQAGGQMMPPQGGYQQPAPPQQYGAANPQAGAYAPQQAMQQVVNGAEQYIVPQQPQAQQKDLPF